jgi:glycosyltransferase involved in cell wall biosynthesis
MIAASNAPLVSVLVTLYNRQAYVGACLDSIVASTMADFEVVVVDDCSVDDSAAIADAYALRDSRIRFYRNATNLGDYRNRLRAASLAQGKYLKYVDSDDLIYPHTISTMVEALEREADSALALTHSETKPAQPYPWKLSSHEAWLREFLGDGCMGSGPTGALIRRDAFIAAGGFGDWGVLSDTDLWYRLSARAPIILLPPDLVWWRRHDDQQFTKSGAALVYLERGFELVMQTLGSKYSPLTPDETLKAIKRARQHHARRLLALGIRKRMPAQAIRLFRKSRLSWRELALGLASYQ